jgi:hypothetical protein
VPNLKRTSNSEDAGSPASDSVSDDCVEQRGKALPALRIIQSGSEAPRRLPRHSNSEESDNYRAVVSVLNDRWRVIECRDDIQWILQIRRGHRDGSPIWRGISFCRTRESLERCVRERCGDGFGFHLGGLPEQFSEGVFDREQVVTPAQTSQLSVGKQKQRPRAKPRRITSSGPL